MTKKLLAVVLGLSAWITGTVAATIGHTGTAAAQSLLKLERAHADYTPSLSGNDPIFILVLGSDSRPGTPMNKGRSDSIHILGINPATHRGTLYGIPREWWGRRGQPISEAVRRERGNYRILRVTGESMRPMFFDRALLLVNFARRDPTALRNRPVAAWVPEEEGATVKILREHQSRKYWILRPANPDFDDIIVPKTEHRFQVAAVEGCWERFE